MINVNNPIIPVNKEFAKKYRLSELLNYLGNPQKNIKTINVVGTNGKGSTTTAIANNLSKRYTKVGWFISPAFIYHNERIRINTQMISDEKLLNYLHNYQSLIKEYELTFFEVWTLIMILYFDEEKVDIAVVEAGIGGLLDATNVMINQLMVVVTSLSLDHTEILGNSIQKIIVQKLGIAKDNAPIFISADNLKYRILINDWAAKHPFHQIIWGGMIDDEIDYQRANKGLVVEVLRYLNLLNPNFDFWPLGRFTLLQKEPYQIIIDGAHNEDGWERLLITLNKKKIQPAFLFATSQHKDYQKILTKLNNTNSPIYLTNFDHSKAWTMNPKLKRIKNMTVVDWQEFLKQPLKQDLVISGSLYFIAQVYEWWINNH